MWWKAVICHLRVEPSPSPPPEGGPGLEIPDLRVEALEMGCVVGPPPRGLTPHCIGGGGGIMCFSNSFSKNIFSSNKFRRE